MSRFTFDPFPKYLQVNEILLRWLADFEVGQKLPTEEKLAEQFQVSRITIRQALSMLEEEGIIDRRTKAGTWLKKNVPPPRDRRLTGPVTTFSATGASTKVVVASEGQIAAPEEIALELGVDVGQAIYEFKRLRIFDDAPLLVMHAFLPLEAGEFLKAERFKGDLIVLALQKKYSGITETIQKIEAKSSDKDISDLLDIKEGQPILCVNRKFVDNRKIVLYAKTMFRHDRYYYTVGLPRSAK